MKVKQQLTRKYYKYVTVESSWTQPVLSSNGTIGVDDFAVSSPSTNFGEPYYPLNGLGYVWYSKSNGSYLMYSNIPIRITRLVFSGYYDDSAFPTINSYISNFTFYGSNDGNSWTDLGTFTNNSANPATFNVINNNFYKYYKIAIIGNGGAIRYLQLTATQQTTTIVEGTEDDYDFYEDETALKAFVVDNVYKAMKF